jgi:hypothetical protein
VKRGGSATGRQERADRSERPSPRLPEAAEVREAEGHRGLGVRRGAARSHLVTI